MHSGSPQVLLDASSGTGVLAVVLVVMLSGPVARATGSGGGLKKWKSGLRAWVLVWDRPESDSTALPCYAIHCSGKLVRAANAHNGGGGAG